MPIDWTVLEEQLVTEESHRPPGSTSRSRSSRRTHRPPIPWWRNWSGNAVASRSFPERSARYPATPQPRAFRDLVTICEARSGILGWGMAARYLPGLLALAAHREDWLRLPESWETPDASPDRQFGSLIRHLLARYEVPRFLDAAWTEGLTAEAGIWQGWFRWVATGRNLRDAPRLPTPLTKRVAHHVLQAPDDLGIPAALRYGQVIALGGDDDLARSLAATRLQADFTAADFWASVLAWFVAHPEVAPADHRAIVDYLYHTRFVPQVANPASRLRGKTRQALLVPAQPHLSMKGRTPAALLRLVNRWRHEIQTRPLVTEAWAPSGIAPLVVIQGIGAEQERFETTELIGTDELEAEGQALNHCVYSYSGSCRAGLASIWSLTVEDPAGQIKRLLTLEVRGDQPAIVQAKGHHNRRPTTAELILLTRWSLDGGPELAPAVRMELDLWENRAR